jgi:hypothetical protein
MLPGGSDGNGHLPRPRRPRRAGLAAGGSPGQASQPHPAALPCTDYDVAYFKAYSHIGVHEEMLKVTPLSPSASPASSRRIIGTMIRLMCRRGWGSVLFCFPSAAIVDRVQGMVAVELTNVCVLDPPIVRCMDWNINLHIFWGCVVPAPNMVIRSTLPTVVCSAHLVLPCTGI